MKVLYPYLLVLNYFTFFAAASSPSTTVESFANSRNSSIESLASLNTPDHDRIFVCDEIFRKHFVEFNLRTDLNILTGFNIEIIPKAVYFAAKLSDSFFEVISDEQISIPVHCFLLEYFLKVARLDHRSNYFYAQFIRVYSEAISSQFIKKFSENDHQIFSGFIFPLLKELVSTGNFLHYSILLSSCIDRLNSEQKNELYSIHFYQYFNVQNAQQESALDIETFAFGIEFLNLYIPRYEILSIIPEEYQASAMMKPFGYYLVAFNPLRVVVENNTAPSFVGKPVLTSENEFEALPHLEAFLIKTDFLNFTTMEEGISRRFIFNALIKIENILLLVNWGYLTCFQAWLRFQCTSIDEWTLTTLKTAAYEADNPRFKEIFDDFFQ